MQLDMHVRPVQAALKRLLVVDGPRQDQHSAKRLQQAGFRDPRLPQQGNKDTQNFVLKMRNKMHS